MTKKYASERGNLWLWLKNAEIGFSVELRDGRTNAYQMAKRYGRKIKCERLPNGDYKLTILE